MRNSALQISKANIISLGYRVKSRIVTNFRIWVNERLREYMLKNSGFSSDFTASLGHVINVFFALTFVHAFANIVSASPRVGFSSAGLFVVMEGHNVQKSR